MKEIQLMHYNQALESIRPFLHEDGGDVEVVDFDELGIALIQLKGNCVRCSNKLTTIKTGIESLLTQKFDEIKGVREYKS